MISQFTGTSPHFPVSSPFRPPPHFPPDSTTSTPFQSQESTSSIEYVPSSVAVAVITTSGIPPTSTPLADSSRSETSGDDKTKIIGGIIGGFFLGVLVTVAIFMALCRRRRIQVTKRDTENARNYTPQYNTYEASVAPSTQFVGNSRVMNWIQRNNDRFSERRSTLDHSVRDNRSSMSTDTLMADSKTIMPADSVSQRVQSVILPSINESEDSFYPGYTHKGHR